MHHARNQRMHLLFVSLHPKGEFRESSGRQLVIQNSVLTHALDINDLFKSLLLWLYPLSRKHCADVRIQDARITHENIIRRAEGKLPSFD